MKNAASTYVPRPFLSEDQALEIFAAKLRNDENKGIKVRAEDLARKYGVSSKTIRDIWGGRTWAQETSQVKRQKVSTENGMKSEMLPPIAEILGPLSCLWLPNLQNIPASRSKVLDRSPSSFSAFSPYRPISGDTSRISRKDGA